jgi:hypothetical protein
LRNSPRVQPVLLGDKHTEAIKTREYQQGRLTQTISFRITTKKQNPHKTKVEEEIILLKENR